MPEPLVSGLPAMPRPQGAYVPVVAEPLRPGDVLMATAGMTPRVDGRLTVTGLVGRDVDVAEARRAAAVAARNAVAAVAAGGGELGGVRRWVRMTVYVACADGFAELSAVADGASAVLAELTPALGRPARSAIGVRALPGGAPVEVELTAVAGSAPPAAGAADPPARGSRPADPEAEDE